MRNIRKKLNRYYKYFRVLSFVSAVKLTIIESFMIECLVKVKCKGVCLVIRPFSTDFEVVVSNIYKNAYGCVSLSDPSIIIDAGANIGASAIMFAKRYPKAKILAIEMELDNFSILVENVKPYVNVIPVHAALSACGGYADIYDRNTGEWGYTIVNHVNGATLAIERVECMSVDDIMRIYNLQNIDMIKLDIEGAEKAIFEASSTWVNKIDVICVELHDRFVDGCSAAYELTTAGFSKHYQFGELSIACR